MAIDNGLMGGMALGMLITVPAFISLGTFESVGVGFFLLFISLYIIFLYMRKDNGS